MNPERPEPGEHEVREITEFSSEPAARGLTRRRALQVLAAGAAGAAALPAAGCVPSDPEAGQAPDDLQPGATSGGNPLARGTPTDPDLVSPVVPWEGVLEEPELETLASVCDVILPADARSPSASALGAHLFVDEWVSAPYDANRADLVLVRGGLVWLDVEANRRFGGDFVDLPLEQKHAICDDICYEQKALPDHKAAARFFDKVRDLTSTAFWTTEEGMADLGFVGNRAMPSFDGPPREVLQRLGLL